MARQLTVEEHIKFLLGGEAHDVPCDTCEESQLDMELPPWFDEEKFKRGQKFIQRNIMGQFAVTLSGLLCVLSVPSILAILTRTQKSSSVEGAYRRYLSTLKHVYSWYYQPLRPGTLMWKSLSTVRLRHLRASKVAGRGALGHVSQRDLALTQFGFYGLGLLKPHCAGLGCGRADLEGYVHLWRTIGYLLGIRDRYNLCRESLEETVQITRVVCGRVFRKLLHNPPEFFYHHVEELLSGMWYVDTSVCANSFIYYTYWLVGVPGFTGLASETATTDRDEETQTAVYPIRGLLAEEMAPDNILDPDKFYSSFSWSDKLSLYLTFTVYTKWLFTTLGRLYYNMSVVFTMFYADYFPYLAIWKFGVKRAYVDMFADDIAVPGVLRSNKEMLNKLIGR